MRKTLFDAQPGRAWVRPVLFALLVYAATLAVRMGDLPKWDHEQLRVDGEYIMATHDAYAWLAGAYGVGTGAGSPLARMARAYADLTGRPAGEFAFHAPAVASSLVAVAVMLWAWTLGGLEAGLGAGFLAALSRGFYFRTRLGYYDTDMATLLFPLLQAWTVAHWLAPHLRRPRDLLRGRPEEGTPAPASLAWPLAAGVLVRLGGADWHTHLPDFNLLVAGAALGLVLLLGRPSARPRLVWGVAVFGLAGYFANPGLAMAAGLVALFRWAPRLTAPSLGRLWPSLAVVVLVLALAGVNRGIVGKALQKFEVYSKTTVEVAGGLGGNLSAPAGARKTAGPPVYPGITQSVVEAQNVPMQDVLGLVLPKAWLTVAGMAGFLLVVFLRPVAVFLAPLLALALLGQVLGARMTMFGGPAAALGLCLPLVWGLRRVAAGRAWGTWASALASAALGGVLMWPALAEYASLDPTPILTKPHAVALKALSRIAPPGSRVWTWWDWGYASQYYSRRTTFADGARHSGEYLFPLALALTTSVPLQSSQVIAYAALQHGRPWEEWNRRSAPEVAGFVQWTARNRFAERPRDRQYLVVAWENLRLAYWITYYGSWDVAKGDGVHGTSQEVGGTFTVDNERGLLISGARSTALRSLDVLSARGREYRELPNARGAHLVLNELMGQAMLLDDLAYGSLMVQMLMTPPDDPGLRDCFRLVYDGFPMVRIFEAL